MFYRNLTKQRLAGMSLAHVDARHVEAWMRLDCGTFDGLSPAEFTAAVKLAAAKVSADPGEAEALARSYGIAP